jgi:predicted DsbA family dithiol-disulfide isomerase
MIIDFVYDFLCPWCFVAKRQLELAIARVQPKNVSIRWHQFMLYPEFDRGGHEFLAFFRSKYGDALRVPMWDAIRAVAEPIGIKFAFEQMTRGPASLDGHRLVRFAARENPGCESALIEHISSSFFEQAKIIDDTFLINAGVKFGLMADRVAALLASADDIDALFGETKQWRAKGVTLMPCFIVDGERIEISSSDGAGFDQLLRSSPVS